MARPAGVPTGGIHHFQKAVYGHFVAPRHYARPRPGRCAGRGTAALGGMMVPGARHWSPETALAAARRLARGHRSQQARKTVAISSWRHSRAGASVNGVWFCGKSRHHGENRGENEPLCGVRWRRSEAECRRWLRGRAEDHHRRRYRRYIDDAAGRWPSAGIRDAGLFRLPRRHRPARKMSTACGRVGGSDIPV